MQLLQLLNGHRQAVVDTILVEEVGQALLLFCLAVGSPYPRSLGQHEVFQFLVFLQLAQQGRLLTVLTFPLFEGGLHLWTLLQQRQGEGIGVVGSGLVDGTVFPGLSYRRQRLHHEPCGIVSIFQGQLLLGSACWEQLRQVNGLHTRLVLGIGHCSGHKFAVGQNGKIVLFTIRETIARSRYLTDKQRVGLVGLELESDITRLTGLDAERQFLFVDGAVALRVYQRQSGLAADCFL